MILNFKNLPRKILSACLCFIMILGICIVPGVIPVDAAAAKSSKVYDFSLNSGTKYTGTVEDSSGISRQISRSFFAAGENEELEIKNALSTTSSGPSGYLFNDADGLFELKASSDYFVSLRVKVVSSQKKFDKNGVTYPTSSQLTELKLAYGMPAVYETTKITMDTEIGLVAKVGSETNAFTANQNGNETTLNVGEWYTLTYNFKTPSSFGENGNVLGLALKSFNGVHILVDDVTVERLSTITVDPNGDTISQTSFTHKIGDKINIENPKYEFGYDFEGWFTDKECTKEFTDQYVTEENCEIKLYAGWS